MPLYYISLGLVFIYVVLSFLLLLKSTTIWSIDYFSSTPKWTKIDHRQKLLIPLVFFLISILLLFTHFQGAKSEIEFYTSYTANALGSLFFILAIIYYIKHKLKIKHSNKTNDEGFQNTNYHSLDKSFNSSLFDINFVNDKNKKNSYWPLIIIAEIAIKIKQMDSFLYGEAGSVKKYQDFLQLAGYPVTSNTTQGFKNALGNFRENYKEGLLGLHKKRNILTDLKIAKKMINKGSLAEEELIKLEKLLIKEIDNR